MDSGDVKSITIRIAGRAYPVKVNHEDEARIQQMEKELNDKIQFYKTEFQDIDHQDALTMTLLRYAFDLSKRTQTEESKLLIHDRLNIIDKMLNDTY